MPYFVPGIAARICYGTDDGGHRGASAEFSINPLLVPRPDPAGAGAYMRLKAIFFMNHLLMVLSARSTSCAFQEY